MVTSSPRSLHRRSPSLYGGRPYGSDRFINLLNEIENCVWPKTNRTFNYSKSVNMVFALADVISREELNSEVLLNERRRVEVLLLILLTQQVATHSLRLLIARIISQLYSRSDPYQVHGILSDLLSLCLGIHPPVLCLNLSITQPSKIYDLPHATLGTAVKVSSKDVKISFISDISLAVRATALDIVGHIIPSFASLCGHCIPYIISSTVKLQIKSRDTRWKVLALGALSRCIDKCGITGVSIANEILSICLNAVSTCVAALTQVSQIIIDSNMCL